MVCSAFDAKRFVFIFSSKVKCKHSILYTRRERYLRCDQSFLTCLTKINGVDGLLFNTDFLFFADLRNKTTKPGM